MLERHGIRDPTAFVGAVMARLPRRGVYLRPDQWEDLEGFLLLELCKLAVTFDPERNSSLSRHLGTNLPRRVADWYRLQPGFGDARYVNSARRAELVELTEIIDPGGLDLGFEEAELRVLLAA